MSQFEQYLRAQLAEAAADAPTFLAAPRLEQGPARRQSVRIAVAASAAAAIGLTGWAFVASLVNDAPAPESKVCANTLTYDKHTFHAVGNLMRVPAPGEAVGTAVLQEGCGGSRENVSVSALAGVSLRSTLVTDDGIWIEAATATLPAAVALLTVPLPCTFDGVRRVVGTWVSVEGEATAEDFVLTTPYVATIKVLNTEVLSPTAWAELQIPVTVASSTKNATDKDLISSTLGQGRSLAVDIRCAGSSYLAEAIEAGP
jgi:hypothetical protein